MSDTNYNVTTKKPVMVGVSAFVALDPFHGDNNISTTDITDTGYASTSFGDNSYVYAFDNNDSTYTGTGSTLPAWIKQAWPVARVVNKYRIKGGGIAANNPTAWKFQGSADNSVWVDLDTRSTTIPTSDWSPYYTFSSNTAYLYHRILVSADGGANQSPRITEIEMCESAGLTQAMCDGFKIIANTGATGTKIFTLPVAGANNGLKITFIRTDNYDLEIDAGGSDIVSIAGVSYTKIILNANNAILILTSKSGGWIGDAVGSYAPPWYLGSLATNGFLTGEVDGGTSNYVEKISLASASNAVSWGTMPSVRGANAGSSSATNGFVSGGWTGGSNQTNTIQTFLFASSSGSGAWGTLTVGGNAPVGHNDQTRAFSSGRYAGGANNTVDSFLMASASNATDWGDLTEARYGANGVSSPIVGITLGGYSGSYSNVIDYFSFASTGNSLSWGTLATANYAGAGTSSDAKGFISGGYNGSSNVATTQTITFSSMGNSTDWNSNITLARRADAGVSSPSKGFCCFGYTGSGYSKVIDTFNFASQGAATSWGNTLNLSDDGTGHQG